MQTGRKRVVPASTAASNASPVMSETIFGEGDDENGVCGGDAHAHDRAHESRYGERGAGEEEKDDDAGDGGG